MIEEDIVAVNEAFESYRNSSAELKATVERIYEWSNSGEQRQELKKPKVSSSC